MPVSVVGEFDVESPARLVGRPVKRPPVQNKYQFKPPLPFTPGSELAGVVKEVATGTCEHALGDRGALQAGETRLVLGAAGGVGIAGR